MQLGIAYFTKERYNDAVNVLKKVSKTQQLARSQAHIVYAKSPEFSGWSDLAEDEFKIMRSRYSNFGQRYEYGLFLIRADRIEEAAALFEQIAEAAPHLSSMERR
ncbi:MAG TPA: hypothetical protein VHS53_11435 [Mucilaginibacter sp.]|jgi:hypothetical protein|nr:hypothetical protein [Mucilaginibacter sp.]